MRLSVLEFVHEKHIFSFYSCSLVQLIAELYFEEPRLLQIFDDLLIFYEQN